MAPAARGIPVTILSPLTSTALPPSITSPAAPAMPGPGPQPPLEGPFFLLMTVTTRNAVDADELAKVFNSQRSKAIEAGATVYAVGRQVDRHVVTIVEAI